METFTAALFLLTLVAATPAAANGVDFLPVSCKSMGNLNINGNPGVLWACTFKNNNNRIPVNNYVFDTVNFTPLRLVRGITSLGMAVAYVCPGGSFTFSFVNSASAGKPEFHSPTNPFVESTVITSPVDTTKFDYSCKLPTYARSGTIATATFTCSISNKLESSAITGIKFDCDAAELLDTVLLTPGCTLPVNLPPAGHLPRKATFKFTVAHQADVNMAISDYILLPNPANTNKVTSSFLSFSSTGWGGWSCPPPSKIVSASTNLTSPASLTLWRPGATATSVPSGTVTTYPNTPFGYTYGFGEEGAIVQNGPTPQGAFIYLVCTV